MLSASTPPVPLTPGQWAKAFHAWREYARGARWARRAARAGFAIFDAERHRWVVSSSPPQMSHEGGRLLSAWTGLPFLADFRDQWRFSEWVSLGRTWLQLAERYEPRVVRQSTLTVANVEPARAVMQRAYPASRVIAITNGLDESPIPPPPQSRRFVIGYTGALYLGRDPEPIFEAVGRLVRERGLKPADIGLEFMGFYEPAIEARLHGLAAEHGISPFVAVHHGRPRPEALEFMAGCAVLVALQQGSDLMIPAKVFDYLRFPSWVLVLAAATSATSDLLKETTADVQAPDDGAGILATIETRLGQFRQSGRPAPLGGQARFSRRFQAELLLEAMEGAAPGRADPGSAPRQRQVQR